MRRRPTPAEIAQRRVQWLKMNLTHTITLPGPPSWQVASFASFVEPRAAWCEENLGPPCAETITKLTNLDRLGYIEFNTEGAWVFFGGTWRFRDPTAATLFKMWWHGAATQEEVSCLAG